MPGGNWKAPKLMPRSGGMRSLKSKAGVTGLCNAPRRGPSPCIPLSWPGIWEGFFLPCSLCAWRNGHPRAARTLWFLTWSLIPSPESWAPTRAHTINELMAQAPPWVLLSPLEGTDDVLGLPVGSAEFQELWKQDLSMTYWGIDGLLWEWV